MKTKPRVITKCIANAYTGKSERIVEFSNGARTIDAHRGGLISFRNLGDGTLTVRVYRLDPGVHVIVDEVTPS